MSAVDRARKMVVFALSCSVTAFSCASHGDGDAERAVASAVVTCPGPTTVSGIDVSSFQGTVDWSAAKNGGIAFAYARLGDGTTLDTKFEANWAAMKTSGVIRGAYQFFEPAQDPTAQANLVVSKVGVLGAGDLPVALDIEITGSQTSSTIVANIHTWINVITHGTGRAPIVYTNKSFWGASVASSDFAALSLWISGYGVTCPDTPSPWTSWAFWQSSATGTVAGVSGQADLDKFNGSLAQLQTLATPPPADAGTITDGAPSGDAASHDASADGAIGAGDSGRADAADVDAEAPVETNLAPMPGPGLWCSMRVGAASPRSLVVPMGLMLVVAACARRRSVGGSRRARTRS